MEYNEIEVKFYIENPRKIKEQIYRMTVDHLGKCFETNVKYEDRNHNLINRNLLVRLRQSEEVTLTVKQPSRIDNTEFKINRELEVTVSDFVTMDRILNILGYHKEQFYEKWRQEWRVEKTTLCLDTLPYGCFLEIEGQPKDIKIIANKVGLNWNKRITLSYLRIFEIMKKKGSINFNNLEFKKFKNPKYFEKYRSLFENNNVKYG